ncbi:flavin reductase [Modestobacter sp. URMC 112]
MTEISEEQRRFRSAMANLSAAVNVVTTDGPGGRAGITVSAVCSVTDDPPTVLVCVNQSSYTHDVFTRNGRICVNVLGAEHEELAMHFAGATKIPMEERFGWEIWDHDTAEVPVLKDALVALVGRMTGHTIRGSHSVMFVEVERTIVREDSGGLVYFKRQFHRLGEPTVTTV